MKNLKLASVILTLIFAAPGSGHGARWKSLSNVTRRFPVHVNVAVKAGFARDPEGQSGITNFMGEMLIRGTELETKSKSIWHWIVWVRTFRRNKSRGFDFPGHGLGGPT